MVKFLLKFLPLILHEIVDDLFEHLAEKQKLKKQQNEQTERNN